MPRARDDRKPVGTEHCDECGTLARFYQVQKGHRLGYLYRRCECGADQRTGAAVQVRWLKTMALTGEPMIPHPLQSQVDEPSETPEPETAEPQTQSGVHRETEPKRTGLIGLGVLAVGVAVALIT